MKDSDLARMVAPSGATAALAADAARAFAGVDVRGATSIGQAISGLNARALGNASAMREATRALDFMRPIVAPQAAADVAEAFKAIEARNVAFTKAVSGIEWPTFQFAKTLDDVRIATQFPPHVSEAIKAMQLPPAYSARVSEALAGLSSASLSGVAPRAVFAVRDAAVIAETPAAAEVADDALVDLGDLSPTERRELQKDVANAIAALGTIVAVLAENGRLELASATLAFLAILVSIYWRVSERGEDGAA
jgi:hypothetical protein